MASATSVSPVAAFNNKSQSRHVASGFGARRAPNVSPEGLSTP